MADHKPLTDQEAEGLTKLAEEAAVGPCAPWNGGTACTPECWRNEPRCIRHARAEATYERVAVECVPRLLADRADRQNLSARHNLQLSRKLQVMEERDELQVALDEARTLLQAAERDAYRQRILVDELRGTIATKEHQWHEMNQEIHRMQSVVNAARTWRNHGANDAKDRALDLLSALAALDAIDT